MSSIKIMTQLGASTAILALGFANMSVAQEAGTTLKFAHVYETSECPSSGILGQMAA